MSNDESVLLCTVVRKNKRCKFNNCMTRPAFNLVTETTALYCSQHKSPNMIDVRSRRCQSENCMTRPTFNFATETTAKYCSQHKLSNMIDVRSRRCKSDNCMTRPAFNFATETIALYCSQHKLPDMINIVSKRCQSKQCLKQPNFNFATETTALYCSQHKLLNMIDVRSKKCLMSFCDTQVQTKYDGYCLRCYMNLFQDKSVTRNYKTKEKHIVDHITSTFPDVSWVHDKRIQDGCSARRPDLFLDMGTHIVIIEIDENRHDAYDCTCENKRIMQLSQDVGHRPMVFLRFNPDSYTKQDGTTISSCWGVNGLGVLVLKKSKRKEWDERMQVLKDHVQYWMEHPTEKTIEINELFY